MLLGLCCFFFLSRIGLTQSLQRYEYTHQQMGTSWKLIFYHNNPQEASQIRNTLFLYLDSLNQIFSDYLLDSELNQLSIHSGDGRWHQVSRTLCNVIRKSQDLSKETNGMLDISVGPLSKIWRRAFRRQEFPNIQSIASAKEKVNYKWIRVREEQCKIKLNKKGMLLDLGAVAKGETLDLLASYLMEMSINKYLIDGGGDIVAGQAPSVHKKWEIALDSVEHFQLENRAIATSGATYQYLINDGQKFSHIIDPRKGFGVQGKRIITVQAPTGFQADAWATILSIVKEERLSRWRKKLSKKQIQFKIYHSHQQ